MRATAMLRAPVVSAPPLWVLRVGVLMLADEAGEEADRMKNECAYLLKMHSITMLVLIGHERHDQ